MIGIYQDDFKDYLEETLGHVKVTSKNLIIPCCWCEYPKEKDHYHLYISLEAPIFHCFKAGCEERGTLKKLLKKIEGHDISETFIDKEKLEEFKKQRNVFADKDETTYKVILPDLNIKRFPNKELYIKKRLKFSNVLLKDIKGLIFDVEEFINVNELPIYESLFRMKDYLQNNFVGFLTENNTTAIFRNIDSTHTVKFYKMKIQDTRFLDYYRLPGNSPESKKVVLAEGVFDIFSEYMFDRLNIKDNVKIYASALSSAFVGLLQSIVYHEQVFRPDVVILSDRGVNVKYYKKLRDYNSHLFNTLTVYYNKAGKDFNDTPLVPDKQVIEFF